MSAPLVSVIMPVYNSEKYLAEAIESILSQTYPHFEFLVANDGSTDSSQEILGAYARKDARIRVTCSEQNYGYVRHLNECILRARGEYIARMDSDDVALPDRLALQVDFLRRHPEVAVVGSSSITISDVGTEIGLVPRNGSPGTLLWQSFFTNPLSHPTVMFRKSEVVKAGMYDHARIPAEDYELWSRVLRHTSIANIEQPLLRYRVHPMSVSALKEDLQMMNFSQALKDHWQHFCNMSVSDSMVAFLKGYHRGCTVEPGLSRTAFYLIVRLYFQILRKTGIQRTIERDAFGKLLYLALRSREASVFTFAELSVILCVLFPLMTLKKMFAR